MAEVRTILTIDEQISHAGKDDEQGILDSTGGEVGVTRQTGHQEDVYDVIGHDLMF